MRREATFRQNDVTRALRAAAGGGREVGRVEIAARHYDRHGRAGREWRSCALNVTGCLRVPARSEVGDKAALRLATMRSRLLVSVRHESARPDCNRAPPLPRRSCAAGFRGLRPLCQRD